MAWVATKPDKLRDVTVVEFEALDVLDMLGVLDVIDIKVERESFIVRVAEKIFGEYFNVNESQR